MRSSSAREPERSTWRTSSQSWVCRSPTATTVGYWPFCATWSRDGPYRPGAAPQVERFSRNRCRGRTKRRSSGPTPPRSEPAHSEMGREGDRARRPPRTWPVHRFGVARRGSTITRRRFRAPLGPRAELQAHRLLGHDGWLVFPARCKRTPGTREGLPCPVGHVRCICGQAQQQSHALAQVRWVIARFRDAGEPGWIAPDDDELRLHFDDQFLSEVPAAELIAAITSVAANLREEPTVIGQAPLSAHIQIRGLEVFAAAEANPPHRLTGLQAPPTGRRITDPRVAAPL